MRYYIEEPNQDNVEVGDIIVINTRSRLEIWPVKETEEKFVRFAGGCAHYHSMVVLKQNGSFLVGHRIKNQLEDYLKFDSEIRK